MKALKKRFLPMNLLSNKQQQVDPSPAATRHQDVLRLQTSADEREITMEKVQKREDTSAEKACLFFLWRGFVSSERLEMMIYASKLICFSRQWVCDDM